MKGFIRGIAIALVALGLALPASAQRRGGGEELVLLGEQRVGFRVDRDVIEVARAGVSFSGLRIQAIDNDVHMIALRLIYQNGYAEELRVDRELRAGADALSVNLDRARSYLKQIELTYRARPDFRGSATVRVYGEVHREPRRDTAGSGGFEVIDTQTVHRRSRDPAVFDVGRREGRFASLRFQAQDGDISIEDVSITFGNGETQRVSVEDRLREGETTRTIDLEGDRRFIRSVRVTANPTRGNRSAKLVLLGRADAARETPRRPRPDIRGFNKVAEGRISRRDDDGLVEFDVGRDEGRLAELRFMAEDGDIRIGSAEIVFGNGERQVARIRDRLEENELSDVIDLAGEQRFVRKVTVRARLARGERAANLVLLAREDAGHRGYRGRGRDDDRGDARGREEWVTLGTNRANMFKADSDTFTVGREMGTFRAIRVAVQRQDVRFFGMTIRYGNGQTEDVPLTGTIDAGQVSQPFDLKGRDRFIESITFKYRSRISLKGSGRVEVQGLKHGPYRGR